MPALIEAQQGLDALRPQDLTEMRSFVNPVDTLRLIGYCILIYLGHPTISWKDVSHSRSILVLTWSSYFWYSVMFIKYSFVCCYRNGFEHLLRKAWTRLTIGLWYDFWPRFIHNYIRNRTRLNSILSVFRNHLHYRTGDVSTSISDSIDRNRCS